MTGLRARVTLVLAMVGTASAAPPPGFHVEDVLTGVTQPMMTSFLPDGRMLVLTKGGGILIHDPQGAPNNSSPYMTITDITTLGERGLLDITLDPDFDSNNYFYVYYQRDSSSNSRLSRFTHLGDTGDLASEFVVWEYPHTQTAGAHYGAGLDFGPDGMLYLTTGDEFEKFPAQDLSDPSGKVIRVAPDGSIPLNPFADGDGPNLEEVWAYGLRNPFSARWDLVTQRLFIAEVGGNNQQTAWEDVHVGQAGANYGWPLCEGPCVNEDFPECDCEHHDDPLHRYPHLGNGACLIGGPVYRNGNYPASYEGAYFYADHVRHWMRYLTFDGAGSVTGDFEFGGDTGSLQSIEQGPDGALYYTTVLDSAVRRIVYVTGDLNSDGVVDTVDFLQILASWGPCPNACPPYCVGDLDEDCVVGVTDFLTLLANWS